MGVMTVIWWRDIPAQVVAREGRRPSKTSSTRASRSPSTRPPRAPASAPTTTTSRSGAREQRALRRRHRGRGRRRGRAARGRVRQAPPRRAHPVRRRRRRPGAAAGPRDADPAQAETPRHDRDRPQLRDPRGRHRLRPAVRDHRRADQPDRPQAPGRGDEGRRLQPGRARRRSPRSRPAPTCSTSTPASRWPTSRRSWPRRSSSSSR